MIKQNIIARASVGYIRNSLHLARKYAQIFLRKHHYLFREANSFPIAYLQENCELSLSHASVKTVSFPWEKRMVGSITSRCSGKEPALELFSGRVDQTRESGGNRA